MADETPDHRFAPQERVRLTMTQRAEDGLQVPHGALGTVVSAIDAEGSRFEVVFHHLDGREPAENAGEPMAVAHVPVAFLESVEPPPQADHRSDGGREQDEFRNTQRLLLDDSHQSRELAEAFDHPVREVPIASIPIKPAKVFDAILERKLKLGELRPGKWRAFRAEAGRVTNPKDGMEGGAIEMTLFYRREQDEETRA